jgi:hypothetical protein
MVSLPSAIWEHGGMLAAQHLVGYPGNGSALEEDIGRTLDDFAGDRGHLGEEAVDQCADATPGRAGGQLRRR